MARDLKLRSLAMRLVICHDCGSIEEVPDFSGPPEHDVLLSTLLDERHRFPNGDEHRGNMVHVEDDKWAKPGVKDGVLKEIRAGIAGGDTGFESEFYASKNTYQEDAMTCFNRHGRPVVSEPGCPDYKDGKKRIGNPSKAGWQGGPKVYLCDFCPYKSTVETAVNFKKGMYK